jgi:hypothetical protein
MAVNEKEIVHLIHELDAIKKHRSYSTGFNIFKSTGMVRQEIKHSNFLGFLLDPQEQHGLGSQFVKSIIFRLASNNENSGISQLGTLLNDYDDLKIKREWSTPESKLKIDLVAWSKENKSVFVIENKVDASAGKNQLSNYAELIEKHSRFSGYKVIYIFLTKNADDSNEGSWLSLGYEDISDIAVELLKENESSLSLEIKTAINHYIDLLRRYIVGDEDLVAQCSRIIQQYGEVMTFIWKHGDQLDQGTDFITASDQFHKENSLAIKELEKKPVQYSFIPNALDLAVRSWPGTNFRGHSKPIVMWFWLRGDDSVGYSLGLILEVGPIGDKSVNRNQLVSSLQEIFGRKRTIKDVYSRVWSEYVRLEDDFDAGMIFDTMQKLWSKFNDQYMIEVVGVAAKYLAQPDH